MYTQHKYALLDCKLTVGRLQQVGRSAVKSAVHDCSQATILSISAVVACYSQLVPQFVASFCESIYCSNKSILDW